MKSRSWVTIFGDTFDVPTHIQRIDISRSRTHGWQVRLGLWQYFSDNSPDGSGSARAFDEAVSELKRRMKTAEAPTGLRSEVNKNKSSDLPVGISGPTSRTRAGRASIQYYFQVTYPVAGDKPNNRSVYIATENTMTQEKYDSALAKAISIRDAGVRKMKSAANARMRLDAEK